MDGSGGRREGSRGRWGRERMVLLQLALVPLVAGGVELGVRGYLAATDAAWNTEAARAEVRAIASSMIEQAPDPYEPVDALGAEVDLEALDQKLLMHPFYGWDKRSSLDTIGYDAERFERLRAAPDGTYRVMVLGGSVAARFARGGEERLGELLLADTRFPAEEVEFVNYARGGFKQPQPASELAYLFALGIVPHAVIEIDGFNEIMLSVRNDELGMHPTYPASAFWAHFARDRFVDPEVLDLQVDTWTHQRAAQRCAAQLLEGPRLRSAALGSLGVAKLERLRGRWIAAQRAYTEHLASSTHDVVISGPAYERGTESLLDITIRAWSQSSRSMRALCAERGVLYLHVLQPTMADEGSKPLTADEEEFLFGLSAHLDTIREGYERMRAAGRELTAAGVTFVDATDVFAGVAEDRYLDHCHFGPKGNRELAERVAPAFLDALRP